MDSSYAMHHGKKYHNAALLNILQTTKSSLQDIDGIDVKVGPNFRSTPARTILQFKKQLYYILRKSDIL